MGNVPTSCIVSNSTCNDVSATTLSSFSTESFPFGASTIQLPDGEYNPTGNFTKFIAGLAYMPCIAILLLAMISRHRFEERVTAASRSSRMSRPWLRVIQLTIIAFVLRAGWFWSDASGYLDETCPCVKGCSFSGFKCAGPIFKTLLNRLGQVTYICALSVTISCWVAVSAKGAVLGNRRSNGCSFAETLPPFLAVVCTWVMLVTAFLVVLSLLDNGMSCEIGNTIYQAYILQVRILAKLQ